MFAGLRSPKRVARIRRKLRPNGNPCSSKRTILHICTRETIRPLRDRVLTLSGFDVDSTLDHNEGLSMFWAQPI